MGIDIVVSAGLISPEISIPSNPVIDRSFGTLTPAFSASAMAPIARRSLPHIIAVGGFFIFNKVLKPIPPPENP